MTGAANLSQDFFYWLKTKKNNDYWLAPDVPENYALEQYNYFRQQLQDRTLECRQLTWFVTNRCDLACEHCGVSANERAFSELTLEQFAAYLPEFKKLGLEYITLSGGEPLVRRDIYEILSFLKIHGFKVGMVSNGSKLRKFSEKMKNGYKLDTISISIDGLEKNHSLIRKSKTNFKKALNGIKYAKEAGVSIVSVHTCIYPSNYHELEELKQLFFSQGADQWIIRPVTPSGRAFGLNDYSLSKEKVKDLLVFARENVEKGFDITVGSDLGYLGRLDSYLYLSPYFCSVGWNSMVLLPNGDIKGFDERHLPLEGNILTDELKKVWFEKFKYYREPEIPENCLKCEYYSRCRGGYLPGAEMGKRCIKPVLELLENG